MKRDKKSIKFEFFAPSASSVYVAGTFNHWDLKKNPLKKSSKGKWRLSLELPLGRYEYRFLVDDQWHNDQKTVECVPNVYGTWNCVLVVK